MSWRIYKKKIDLMVVLITDVNVYLLETKTGQRIMLENNKNSK